MEFMIQARAKFYCIFVASLLASSLAYAVGEQTGRILGRVTEEQTGAPVPGATVTVQSPSQIGGAKSTTTAEDGSFEISDLMPGSYSVEVTYAGVKPIRRQVLVQQGTATPVNIAWSAELAQAETTVVVEERHLTRPDTTMTGSVLSLEGQNNIATGRTYQNVALEVAGVANPNNAGNPQIKGANLMMNRYLLDGLDVSDPILNTFSVNLNFDSIESLQVITGGMEAQYNAMGGIINVISSPGSDEFRVDSSIYGNHYKLSAPNQYGASYYDGAKPFSDVPRPPTSRYDGNINVSGPIMKHSLWFAASYQYTDARASQPAGPPLNVQAPGRHSITNLGRLKLTWGPNAQHRVTATTVVDPAIFDYVAFNGPAANNTVPLAATRQDQGSIAGNLIWEFFPAENWGTKLQLGMQFNKLDNGPQGVLGSIDPKYGVYDFLAPRHVNQDDGIAYQNAINLDVNRRRGYTLDFAFLLRGRWFGSHDAQAGIQTRFLNFSRWLNRTGAPIDAGFGPLHPVFTDSGGGPGFGGLCDDGTGTTGVSTGNSRGCSTRDLLPDLSFKSNANTAGVYIQDRWKPIRWLTVLPGLRFDWGNAYNNPINTVERDVNPNAEKVASIWGFGPRLGATVDLTGDQKTIFSAFYGRSNDTNALLVGSNTQRQAPNYTYQWNPTGPLANTWSLTSQGGGNDFYQLDTKNHTPPHSDEVTLSLRREVYRNSVAGIEYTYKRLSNLWDTVQQNIIYDPSGTRQIDFVDGRPHSVGLVTTPDKNYSVYNGVDLIYEGRPTPALDLYAAYTLSYRTGVSDEEFGQTSFLEPGQPNAQAFQNPRIFNLFYGFLPGDIRHTIKFHGFYTFRGITIGPNITYRSGVTQRSLFASRNGPNFFRSPQGTEPGTGNDPNQISEFKTPDLLILNARVQYNFRELIGQNLILIGDVFNVFNSAVPSSITVVRNTPINRVGEINARLPEPLRFQLGVRYIY